MQPISAGLWIFRRVILRDWVAHPARPIAILLAMSLGVAFVGSVRGLVPTLVEAFRLQIQNEMGPAAIAVTGGTQGIPRADMDAIARLPGVTGLLPRIVGRARIIAGAQSVSVPVIGVNTALEWMAGERFSAGTRLAKSLRELDQDLTQVMVTAPLARRLGLPLGGTFYSGQQKLQVGAITPGDGMLNVLGQDLVVLQIGMAQQILGRPGVVDRLDLVLARDAMPAQVAASIDAAFSRRYGVETAFSKMSALERAFRAHEISLQVVGLLCWVAGLLVVLAISGLEAARRAREEWILRSVGIEPVSLATATWLEALLLGSGAGLLGWALATQVMSWLATGTIATLAQQNRAFLDQNWVSPALSEMWARLPIFWVLGVVTAGLARVLPRVRSWRLPRGTMWVGAVLLASLAFAPGPARRAAWFVIATVAFVFVTSSVLARVARWVRARLGDRSSASTTLVLGGIAAADRAGQVGALGLLCRTASSCFLVAALIAVVHQSVLDSIDDYLLNTSDIDFGVAAGGAVLGGQGAPLPATALSAIYRLSPEYFSSVAAARRATVSWVGHGLVTLRAVDPQPKPWRVLDTDPIVATAALHSLQRKAVFVSQGLAEREGLHRGDAIRLQTPRGEMSFDLAGVIEDYMDPQGAIYMGRALYLAEWQDGTVNDVRLGLRPGVDPLVAQRALQNAIAGYPDLGVRDQREIREQLRELVGRGFSAYFRIQKASLWLAAIAIFAAVLIWGVLLRSEAAILKRLGARSGLVTRTIVARAAVTVAWAVGASFLYAAGAHAFHLSRRLKDTVGWVVPTHVPYAEIPVWIGWAAFGVAIASWALARFLLKEESGCKTGLKGRSGRLSWADLRAWVWPRRASSPKRA